ncbi:hypothetical protein [Kribbella sp. NPDC051620]|uniref:hypothetical protein n=1 Tax=Kribbella sp. NPDC051620 TaxID=3364120 RepID=UPI0037A22806
MLAELHAEIARQGGYDDGAGAEPVVSLELFFDGNEDPASIGCNLPDHPGPARFYEVLSAIRDRPEVDSVWVGVSEVTGPDDWPFSDHVYVVTTVSPFEVASWAVPLSPGEPGDDWWNGVPPLQEIEIPPPARLVTLWWD